jgi:hypothetical protein
MKSVLQVAFVSLAGLILVGLLLTVLSCSVTLQAPTALLFTATPTFCPRATPEPFWVDPITSPTRLLAQDVQVYLGNCEAVTVSAESGTFTATGGCYPLPAPVHMALLPNTTHHLLVLGKVRRVVHDGCVYGGYTLSTWQDRLGAPLVITQQFIVTSTSYLPLISRDYPFTIRWD